MDDELKERLRSIGKTIQPADLASIAPDTIAMGVLKVHPNALTDSILQFLDLLDPASSQLPQQTAISDLIAAGGNITEELLAAVVPGWDIAAGVAASRKFLDAPC